MAYPPCVTLPLSNDCPDEAAFPLSLESAKERCSVSRLFSSEFHAIADLAARRLSRPVLERVMPQFVVPHFNRNHVGGKPAAARARR